MRVQVALGAGVCTILLFAGPAPRFEVASIRPHDPSLQSSTMNLARGGTLSITGMTIKNVIWLAWHLPPERVTGGPKWLDSDLYDIRAKSAAGSSSSMDDQYLRIQALLSDRLQLKVHRETKESPVYFLSVARSGLRMEEAKGPNPDAAGKGTILPWNLFVMDLSRRLSRTVVDKTGFTGAWYVKLLYSTDDGQAAGMGVRIDQSHAGSGPSIFTAVQEQLGLKLDSGKGPVDTLVVDSVARPSAN